MGRGMMNLLSCAKCGFTIAVFGQEYQKPCPICGDSFVLPSEKGEEEEDLKVIKAIQAIRKGILP